MKFHALFILMILSSVALVSADGNESIRGAMTGFGVGLGVFLNAVSSPLLIFLLILGIVMAVSLLLFGVVSIIKKLI